MAKAKVTFSGFSLNEIGLDRMREFPAWLNEFSTEYGIYRTTDDYEHLVFIPHNLKHMRVQVTHFDTHDTMEDVLNELDLHASSVDIIIDENW